MTRRRPGDDEEDRIFEKYKRQILDWILDMLARKGPPPRDDDDDDDGGSDTSRLVVETGPDDLVAIHDYFRELREGARRREDDEVILLLSRILPRPERDVLAMRHFERMPLAAISKEQGEPLEVVERQYLRAIRTLRAIARRLSA